MKILVNCLAFVLIFSFMSCSKSDSPALPAASIQNVKMERTTSGMTFEFKIYLDKAATEDVSIHYFTTESTAKENVDYLPASGTATIPTGSKTASILVQALGDSTRKENQIFYVKLDNPEHCTLAVSECIGSILNDNGTYFPVDNAGYTTPTEYPGKSLAWSDEFDGHSINSSNWTFELGNNNGWGNNELENYTDRVNNAFVSEGNLIIEARPEGTGGTGAGSYTSARMVTKGKRSFQYGRIDMRAKLPKGQGIWPALWLLGENIDQVGVGWPACGEIDVMELLGQEPNKVYGTLHWGVDFAHHLSDGKNLVTSSPLNEEFHVYSLVWEHGAISILVDDQTLFSKSGMDDTYPFNNQKFFLIFNIAVGGNWPGNPDGTTTFPQRMIVDYVRVFQ